jgi:hypothetical protein
MEATERVEAASGAELWLVGAIGAWFIATAVLWNRTDAGRLHAVVVGLACLVIALAATRLPAVRWLYVPLGLWLVASQWIIPYQRHFAAWNNVALGAGLLLLPIASRAFAESPRAAHDT